MKTNQAVALHSVLGAMMAGVGIPGVPSAAGDHLPVWGQIILQVVLITAHVVGAIINSNTSPDGKKL